jgi:hypothetical protein
MKQRFFYLLALTLAAALFITLTVAAQKKTLQPDLSKITDGKSWKVSNRKVTLLEDGGRKAIHFNEAPGLGVAWLEGMEFTDGVIEFDARGKDEFQKSFLGVAFRGVDEKTYDSVYFRPFNFKAEDPERRIHAVQYVSDPDFPWHRLRKEHNGQYEKAIFPKPDMPAPDPNGWFHARIVIAKPKVSVYVNEAKEPSLVVDEISNRKGGWVGFWVGSNSGGTFANLKITPAK